MIREPVTIKPDSFGLPRFTYPNRPEADLRQLATLNHWAASKRGWPDFICTREDGSKFAVEVKPRLADGSKRMKLLKREQAETMRWLTSLGVECYVSDGVTLEPWNPDIHAPTWRRRNHGRPK